ncbi:MAG: SDR family oxidoreductase [Deltaproteobacteria bacterium]|nr:SDR family oxidoreductase [Deltaproteobacteria bacterium]
MAVAVITGAGGGLGSLIARGLHERGYTLLLTDVDQAAIAWVAEALGSRTEVMVHDVVDPETHRAVGRRAAELGRVGLWINNAGILRTGYVWAQSDDELRLHSDVNFLGLMYGCRQAVQLMRDGGGHIINIASMSSFVPTPGIAAYGASKHAVLGFSLSLQGELEAAGLPVRVSTLCPDVFDTDLVRQVEDRQEASILFARPALSAQSVAEQALALVEEPQLVKAYPRSWGLLARMSQPLPGAALFILKKMRKRGQR